MFDDMATTLLAMGVFDKSGLESTARREPEKKRHRGKGMGIPVPKFENMDDFRRACGLPPLKKTDRPWQAMPKGWAITNSSVVA